MTILMMRMNHMIFLFMLARGRKNNRKLVVGMSELVEGE